MIDSFGRTVDYLRVSLTDRCNYRCLYCMKETGVEKKSHADILSLEDVYAVIRTFAELGGKKVRFTGGEPLVRKGVVGLMEKVGKLGFEKIGLTTNGAYLTQYAEDLSKAGVTAVNVSIDSLDPAQYAYVTKCGILNEALDGLRAAVDHFAEVKLNAVLMRGINDDKIEDFADFADGLGIPVRFIELMPFAENDAFQKYGVSANEVKEKYDLTLVETVGNTDYFALPSGKKVGFIRPLSHKFCAECNRLRLTSDGKILPCLHGDKEIDLKPYLKNENIAAGLLAAAEQKPACHNMDSGILQTRRMNYIGG